MIQLLLGIIVALSLIGTFAYLFKGEERINNNSSQKKFYKVVKGHKVKL